MNLQNQLCPLLCEALKKATYRLFLHHFDSYFESQNQLSFFMHYKNGPIDLKGRIIGETELIGYLNEIVIASH
jgi:hypothetical protein